MEAAEFDRLAKRVSGIVRRRLIAGLPWVAFIGLSNVSGAEDGAADSTCGTTQCRRRETRRRRENRRQKERRRENDRRDRGRKRRKDGTRCTPSLAIPYPKKSVDCTRDEACCSGFCGEDRCFQRPHGMECTAAAQCSSRVCENGACRGKLRGEACTRGPECVEPLYCIDGMCGKCADPNCCGERCDQPWPDPADLNCCDRTCPPGACERWTKTTCAGVREPCYAPSECEENPFQCFCQDEPGCECCGDLVCEQVAVCPRSAQGPYCCAQMGKSCGQDCDCCGDLVCPGGTCCVSFGETCTMTTQCCGACEGGTCCSNQGGECETDDDCCSGFACDGAIPGVLLGECAQS